MAAARPLPSFRGEMFVYHPEKRLVAFVSDGNDSNSAFSTVPGIVPGSTAAAAENGVMPGKPAGLLLFVGGLTDGLCATNYLVDLSAACSLRGAAGRLGRGRWALVQTLLSSSGSGWGIGSLQRDTEELDGLLGSLGERYPSVPIVFLGHSTGCQNFIHLLKHGLNAGLLRGGVLQAPVSDRDYLATLPETSTKLAQANALILRGDAETLLPSRMFDAPVTAYRYHSLAARGGDDDMFSEDFTDAELAERLGHVKVPVLFLMSLADEYVPAETDQLTQASRQAEAMTQAPWTTVGGGDWPHAPEEPEHVKELVGLVMGFLDEVERKGLV